MRKIIFAASFIALGVALNMLWHSLPAQGSEDDASAWHLYRSSAVEDVEEPIHVATFDADEGEEYNEKNCEIARELFQAQGRLSVRYWCTYDVRTD